MKIDLILFDKWLDEYLYVRPKYRRTEIIKVYKRFLKDEKNILDFEDKLDRMGWSEITINHISEYILYPDYRIKQNKKLKEGK